MMAEDIGGDDVMEGQAEPANHGQPSSKPANHTECPALSKGETQTEDKEQTASKADSDVQLPQNDVHTDVASSGSGDASAVAMETKVDGSDVGNADDANCTDGDHKSEEFKDALNSTDEKRTEDDAMETLNSEAKAASESKVDRTRQSSSESSDSDTDTNEEDEDDESKKVSDHEISSDVENELLARELPKPKLQAVRQIKARELGYYQRCGLPFCHNFTGSVALVQRLEKYCELKHHEGCVNTLHFNQSGELLASGSDDLEIVLWDWSKKRPRLIFESGHRSNVFQAKFMPCSGDSTLVSCARDGQVRVAELSTTNICKETKKIVQHKGAAHKLGLEPESPVVFMSCGEDAAVYNIDLREEKPDKLLLVKEDGKKVALYTININPSNVNEFTVGGRDHFVRVYDKRKITDDDGSNVVKKFCPQHLLNNEMKANVTCCLYSHNGGEILASYNDEDLYLFDSSHSDGADFIHSYKGHRNNATVKGVNFYGPNSEFIVSGSDCGNVFLWEKESEKIVQYMQGDMGGVVNCLEPHPAIACLATSGLDHDVKVWLPTKPEPTDLSGLKKVMLNNRREREEDRQREPDIADGAMLRFLMTHLRHRARRQAREAGELDSDSDSDSTDSDDLPTAQCATS